jgi:hypothetical protein
MRVPLMAALFAAAVASGCTDQIRTPAEPEAVTVPVRFESARHAGTPRNFRTHASGGEEVPPNDSRAQGQAIFQLSKDGTEIHYKLIVANIQNVAQAHIHLGPAGVNGPVIVWLYPSGPPPMLIPGRTQGILAEGVITDASLVGLLAGGTLEDLLNEMRAENTYVNVHTSQFPPGEVRGQIQHGGH